MNHESNTIIPPSSTMNHFMNQPSLIHHHPNSPVPRTVGAASCSAALAALAQGPMAAAAAAAAAEKKDEGEKSSAPSCPVWMGVGWLGLVGYIAKGGC